MSENSDAVPAFWTDAGNGGHHGDGLAASLLRTGGGHEKEEKEQCTHDQIRESEGSH